MPDTYDMTHPDPVQPGPDSTVVPPWYQQFWPWFLLSWPAIAVVAGIITVVIAVKNPDELVDDDYYKSGLAINRVLDREQRAASLKIQADVTWQPETGQIMLQLTSTAAPESRLVLKLLHPTLAHQDLNIPLQHQGEGRYIGLLDGVPVPGNWHLILTPEDKAWRLTSRARLPGETHWQLAP